ncbi:MAG: geranylgeranyl reductase family protein [Pseudomonadota bacterium]|nr:geranylgeranyl reductase family protein [Pseudomonadota bacterium]MDP1903425.1 geranylgeranyl reductase family protein [Pseudomonadota bacterium]MDP2352138.1 geranylgeranyl reductase family protein [Pseudomonadota bacterium]
MKKHHQVLIIGAGPAGSAAAHTLARHGVDVGVIDKARFPRDKLCGGLLTLRSAQIYQRIFARPWDAVIRHTAHGVKFLHQGKVLNEVRDRSDLFFTRRLDFDHFLLEQALEHGTHAYLDESVVAIDTATKTCRLRSGGEIGYGTLIGADGVNSLVAKTLFGHAFDQRKVAFALELEVERADYPERLDDPEIHFGLVRWGYGWVFPKQDTLTVGVGGIHARNPEMKAIFESFLCARFGHLPAGKIKGHYLPFGDYRKVPGRGDVLLCGDAAGLVEPITGEGIAFAMQSGLYAAEAIIAAGNGPALPGYRRRYREITRDFDHANRLRHLLFPEFCQRLFLKALPKSETLPLKHLELMAGTLSYGDYSRHLLGRMVKRLSGARLFRPAAGSGQ